MPQFICSALSARFWALVWSFPTAITNSDRTLWIENDKAFPASPFDGDLAEMGAAGLVTEGLGQLIEGEAVVQDRAYPRLFERGDIILLLAPAADHKSLQARLLGPRAMTTPDRFAHAAPSNCENRNTVLSPSSRSGGWNWTGWIPRGR
jgi:hypothetical protein